MIRVKEPFFRLPLPGLAIGQFELFALGNGFCQRIDDFQIQNRLGAGAEGNGLLDVGKIERNRVGQRLFHFPNGAQERFLKTRAAILLERLLGHHQREEFAFGNLDVGEPVVMPRPIANLF